MYGAVIGDLVGFPYEYKHVDLRNQAIPLFPEKYAGSGDSSARAGDGFSDKTVMAVGMEAGLLNFERKLPDIFAGKTDDPEGAAEIAVGKGDGLKGPVIAQNTFEETCKREITSALRQFGQAHPLAGYSMDLSIWLFREGASPSKSNDTGPAARVSPVAWTFQDDLYMMRHMARLQSKLTHSGKETASAAEAAACAVFLAIHGCTKDYISGYLEREFGYKVTDEAAMRTEILQAGSAGVFPGSSGQGGGESAVCVRAAMTAFLYGKDFEDVLRRAVTLGGRSADIAAIAGSIAEPFFGIPEEIKGEALKRLPEDLREQILAFETRESQKKDFRSKNPAAMERWENALTRATTRHPASVQGNEGLEEAIDRMLEKRDQQTFVTVLETLRLRIHQKGRVFVPLVSAKRAETGAAPAQDMTGAGSDSAASQKPDPQGGVVYRMQAVRTRDGRLWQPAYTSRPRLDKANEVTSQNGDMVLSYALEPLLKRFLPVSENDNMPDPNREPIPAEIEGILFNPYDKPFFLPRKTIEALFIVDREAGRVRPK